MAFAQHSDNVQNLSQSQLTQIKVISALHLICR